MVTHTLTKWNDGDRVMSVDVAEDGMVEIAENYGYNGRTLRCIADLGQAVEMAKAIMDYAAFVEAQTRATTPQIPLFNITPYYASEIVVAGVYDAVVAS